MIKTIIWIRATCLLPELRLLTICCTALKGYAALLSRLLKKSTPSLLPFFCKGHAAPVYAISEGICFNAIRVLRFCLFNAYLMFSNMFAAC